MNVKKVLIVEDDTWLAEQYVRVLTAAGYETFTVSHSLAAIQAVDDINPDVIILDVLLTGTTAFTLMHELQSYADTGATPIILCTSMADDLSEKDLKPYGVKRVLDKTKMAPDDLVVAMKSVLP
jgi:two-component system response regulator BaeR